MFNPYQSRMDSLLQQKQMLEQQMTALQQYQQMPNININNMPQPNNFDFNGRWVNSKDEAMGVANNNLPLIMFDRNNPIFYMKNMDGSFKTFRFEEVLEQPQINNDARIDIFKCIKVLKKYLFLCYNLNVKGGIICLKTVYLIFQSILKNGLRLHWLEPLKQLLKLQSVRLGLQQ